MKRFMIRMQITEDELHGLGFLGDALGEHLRAGFGTGAPDTDVKVRAAASWCVRVASYAHSHPLRRHDRKR